MGFRNATIRQLKVADLTTTVLTLTRPGLAADSHPAGRGSPNWARRVAAVLSISLMCCHRCMAAYPLSVLPPRLRWLVEWS